MSIASASNQQQTPAGGGPKLEETGSQSITGLQACEVSEGVQLLAASPTCRQSAPPGPAKSVPVPVPAPEEAPAQLQDVRFPATQIQHHSTLPSQTSPSSFSNTDTRTHVVGELYDTERSYVESLQILVEKYMKPLKSTDSSRMLIESNLVDEIFYAIPKILQHHEIFLSALQDRISSDWDTSRVIGNVFIEAFTNQQIIDIYTAFINNWKNARQAIKIATQAKPAFERFLEAMSREHRNKLTLDALLIMPVQRIPRYELLIKELIKHTPDDHPDYGPLIEAQRQIHELALKIDHAEREMIHQEQLKDLECLIDGHIELQHPQRDFIRYDLVIITGASSLAMAKKERVLFLFCDLLIMTSVKKKASRRSNLQTAFTNSFNDLSLLEGNKFKLLLRMPLDQIEVRLSNEQTQNYQQQQQELHQAQLKQQQSKYIQERKNKIAADLFIMKQIEALSCKLHCSGPERAKLEEIVGDLSNQLKLNLYELEQVAAAAAASAGGVGEQATASVCSSSSSGGGKPIGASAGSDQQAGSTFLLPLASGSQLPQASTGAPQPPTDLHANQSQVPLSGPISGATNAARTPVHQQQPSLTSSLSFTSASSYVANQVGQTSSSSTLGSQDTSLEFLINSSFQAASTQSTNAWEDGQPGAGCGGGGGSTVSNSEVISGEKGYIVAGSLQGASSGGAGSSSTAQPDNGASGGASSQALLAGCESLVVTFSSTDRKQAFLQAFIEAKQHRYQLHQAQVAAQQQQQQLRQFPKVYSSSVTLKLSQASPKKQPDNQHARVHQQAQPTLGHSDAGSECQLHPPEGCTSAGPTSSGDPNQRSSACRHADFSVGRIPSAPLVHQTSDSEVTATVSSPIVHQMSAPQSLGGLTSRQEEAAWNVVGCQQSAVSALGDSLYCRPMHTQLSDAPSELPGYQPQLISHQWMSSATVSPADAQHQTPLQLLFNVAPKFLLSLPMKFLHTQHPGLQFTCSAGRPLLLSGQQDSTSGGGQQHPLPLDSTSSAPPQAAGPAKLATGGPQRRQQTVRDDSGQLWLCLSNGYVSHVALLSIERQKRDTATINEGAESMRPPEDTTKHYFNVSLVIQSTGDICKSHISCAAQVPRLERRWRKPAHHLSASQSGRKSQPEEHTMGASSSSSSQRQLKSMNSLSLEPNTTGLSRAGSFRSRTVTVPASLMSASRADIPLATDPRAPKTSEPPPMATNNSHTNYCRTEKSGPVVDSPLLPPHTGPLISGASGGPILSALAPQFRPSLERINLVNRSGFHSHLNQHHHSQHHHHHHHHQHHHRHHSHSHQHHVHHHQHHQPPAANVYGARHNTVPLGELKKALESSQSRMGERCGSGGSPQPHHGSSSFYKQRNNHLAPPSNTPFDPANISPTHHRINSLDLAHRGLTSSQDSGSMHHLLDPSMSKKMRATTPPAAFSSIKGSRSSRSLRHQASLKTSAILAKLVSSASKHYLRRSTNSADKTTTQAELEADRGPRGGSVDGGQQQQQQQQLGPRRRLGVDAEDAVVSPLSSVSSLISSNSSVTVNSACASSLKHSSCDLLFHSNSTRPSKCCSLTCQSRLSKECGLRSRSATVPSPSSNERIDVNRNTCSMENWAKVSDLKQVLAPCSVNTYKVNEIIHDGEPPILVAGEQSQEADQSIQQDQETQQAGSSLWLGCDDGSLMVMDCLDAQSESTGDHTSGEPVEHKRCDNRHLEIKLTAAISDIKSHQEKLVFVALNNGQLAIFSRDSSQQEWLMNSPKIVTLTSYELNFTSKLCIVDQERLWYSYGRNIFVLNIESVKLEATIMVPTNDPSLKFSMQPMTIDNMELMGDNGVWISFKNSNLIQLYDVQSHKLMLELSLFEPVNMMLSYGNEILRQHKTACLKATSLLSLFNRKANCNTLFIGTSAGIVLYLNMALNAGKQESGEEPLSPQKPQLASLRHGHSGHVNFLHLVSFVDQESESTDNQPPKVAESVILLSGGKGMDLYGPTSTASNITTEHTQVLSGADQLLNSDDDNLNHLLLWRL